MTKQPNTRVFTKVHVSVLPLYLLGIRKVRSLLEPSNSLYRLLRLIKGREAILDDPLMKITLDGSFKLVWEIEHLGIQIFSADERKWTFYEDHARLVRWFLAPPGHSVHLHRNLLPVDHDQALFISFHHVLYTLKIPESDVGRRAMDTAGRALQCSLRKACRRGQKQSTHLSDCCLWGYLRSIHRYSPGHPPRQDLDTGCPSL
ncbi:hypothetical protein F5Y09DRAFT_321827 [Xylaria sp. FL1042]|nr:hypothetical protein F5Y09DRAFT_321827 [Xylaria sp. FL1042]